MLRSSTSPEVYMKVRELLEIPVDEPIFVLRAQDWFSVMILNYYLSRVMEDLTTEEAIKWEKDMAKVIHDFFMWRNVNPDKIKRPD
jgi:hypothetical protein